MTTTRGLTMKRFSGQDDDWVIFEGALEQKLNSIDQKTESNYHASKDNCSFASHLTKLLDLLHMTLEDLAPLENNRDETDAEAKTLRKARFAISNRREKITELRGIFYEVLPQVFVRNNRQVIDNSPPSEVWLLIKTRYRTQTTGNLHRAVTEMRVTPRAMNVDQLGDLINGRVEVLNATFNKVTGGQDASSTTTYMPYLFSSTSPQTLTMTYEWSRRICNRHRLQSPS